MCATVIERLSGSPVYGDLMGCPSIQRNLVDRLMVLDANNYIIAHMKSQMPNGEISHYYALVRALYQDVASHYPARIQAECLRDLITIRSRCIAEGLSFFTKTLPALGKAIDTALSSDVPLQASSFARKRGSNLPSFLGWLLGYVFNLDGTAKPATGEACLALRHARQLLLPFYKLELPIDQGSVVKTMEAFKQTDAGLSKPWCLDASQRHAVRSARALITRVLANADPRNIVPKHGPGAVATGESNWDKQNFKRFYPELHACYDYSTHFFFNMSHLCDELGPNGYDELEYQHQPPTAKVVLVPKDSRGPRLISMEPLEIQWIQQGLKKVLVDTLESHPLTKQHVNFANQEINRNLALESSRDGSKVTLDMKDASDRVSLQLVQSLFPLNWVECMESCRSAATIGPDGDTVQMLKFAPMGSALCFPVEALCFWALLVSALMTYKHYTPRQAAGRVWVYGDDIILHKEDYLVGMQLLEAVGLKFNSQKCCTGSHFRESCGMDAYNGVPVTPIRFKRRWCSSLDTVTLASWVDYTNRLRTNGYTTTADLLEKEIQSRKMVSYTNGTPAGVQFVEPHRDAKALNLSRGVRYRFNKQYQRLEVRTVFVRSGDRCTNVGWRELLAYTTRRCSDTQRDVDPLPFRRGLQVDAAGLACSFGLIADMNTLSGIDFIPRMKAGVYSVPHRVSSKWGWAQAA